MTDGSDGGDEAARRKLDAAIRAAAERPVDEARLARAVLARVRTDRGRGWRHSLAGGALAPSAAAAIALVLAATPFAVARRPLGDLDPVAGIALTAALGGGDLPGLLYGGPGDIGGAGG